MSDNMRLCSGCNRVYLTQQVDEYFFCPRCYAQRMADYDPQPFRGTKLGEKVPQQSCYVVGDRFRRRYCVLDRDGDRLVLRLLGDPDAEKFEINIRNTSPFPVHTKIQG